MKAVCGRPQTCNPEGLMARTELNLSLPGSSVRVRLPYRVGLSQ